MKFELYPLIIKNILKKFTGSDSPKNPNAYWRSTAEVFKFNPIIYGTLDFKIIADEHYWMQTGCNVLTFPDETIFNEALNSTLDDFSFNMSELPSAFIVAMPVGFTYKGYSIPSCLVVCSPVKTYKSEVIKPFLNSIGSKFQADIKTDGKLTKGKYHLSISNRDLHQAETFCNYCFPDYLIDDFIHSLDHYEFVKSVGDYREEAFKMLSKADDESNMIGFFITKLVCYISYKIGKELRLKSIPQAKLVKNQFVGLGKNDVVNVNLVEKIINTPPE